MQRTLAPTPAISVVTSTVGASALRTQPERVVRCSGRGRRRMASGIPRYGRIRCRDVVSIAPRLNGWSEADIHSVLVVRHGKLVYEHWFSGIGFRARISGSAARCGSATIISALLHKATGKPPDSRVRSDLVEPLDITEFD